MRKLKLQMQTSLDGFASTGPSDEQAWVTWALDEIRKDVIDLADSCDTILIGRKLAMDYIPFWEETVKHPEHEMHDMAQRIVASKKIVFTKTLNDSIWPNTELAKGDLTTEIKNLKDQKGNDIIVYGGTEFVSNLIKEGLIDEFHFFINPVVLGRGVPVFNQIENFRRLKLKESVTFNCGIVKVVYRPI